jgi:hypothetical protein
MTMSGVGAESLDCAESSHPDVVEVDGSPAVCANRFNLERRAAGVFQFGWGPTWRDVAISPLHEPVEDGAKGAARLGQHVLVAGRMALVLLLVQHAGFDQFAQPGGEDVAAGAGVAHDLVEAIAAHTRRDSPGSPSRC